jgi:hypothetical protein
MLPIAPGYPSDQPQTAREWLPLKMLWRCDFLEIQCLDDQILGRGQMKLPEQTKKELKRPDKIGVSEYYSLHTSKR